MSKYNDGDLVEAVKGETVVRGRIRRDAYSPEYQYVGDAATVSHYKESGFEVTVIERAKPKLPTDPGFYSSSENGWLYELTPDGRTWYAYSSGYGWVRTAKEMYENAGRSVLASLVKLAPEVSA